MRVCVITCFTMICIVLYFKICGVSGSLICPSEFEKGVPFDIYGGPLFPIAIYHKKHRHIFPPYWYEIWSPLAEDLVQLLRKSNASLCLYEEHPYCEIAFQNITQIAIKKTLRFTNLIIGEDIWEEYRMDFWGYTGLDDLKDPELVLKRRTIVIACLHWCHGMLALPENERPMMKYLCPNPCKQPGLCMGAADERGSCHLTGDGFFHHQFACNCKPGGLWNAEIGACTNDDDPCKNKKSPPCFPEGTELCSFDRESGGVTCLCKPHYMGDNCSIPANACDDHIRNPLLPNGGLSAIGNRACNINNDGNRCIASLDPNLGPIYSCICTEEHWTGDVTLSYDNCLKKVTNCDKIICINGQCVDSKDGKEAICVCNEGYEGSPSCATFTGIWSSWSPWGQCLPACGSERWALRSRKCLSMESEHSGCRGPTIEFTPCDPHACAVEEGIMMSQYFGAREVTLQAVFVIAAVSAVGLTLFWRYKLYPNLAIRIRQNLRKPQEKNE